MINKIVRIISDNDNYIDYIGIDLVIVARYFQKDRDIEPIYDLNVVDSGKSVPFSLYEYEVEVV